MAYVYPNHSPTKNTPGLAEIGENVKKPLTAERLIEIMEAFYILAPEYRIRGKVFEEWVLRFAFMIPLMENKREFERFNINESRVRPDAVGTLNEWIINFPSLRPTLWGSFPTGVFVEIKALKDPISLHTNKAQIKGEIEAVQKHAWISVPGWFGRRKKYATIPVLVLVTTNVQVLPDVITYANRCGVAVWQYIVYESPTVDPKMPWLSIGEIKNLNQEIYILNGFPGIIPIAPGMGSTLVKVRGN